jgi:eukaryotic-like serine/threonine-protein kinase
MPGDPWAEPLTPERWERVKAIVQDALAHAPGARPAFVAAACAGDAWLAGEVHSLLAADSQAGAFIETPAAARPDMAGLFEAVPAAARPGRRLGPYVLVREIGHGGMGVVYLADRSDDVYAKQVAIKIVRSRFDAGVIQQQFRHERQILADLDHPGIARLIDGGATEDGTPYFVMEFVDGLPIDRYGADNRLSIDARLALFSRVCEALQYAHQRLVIHRDLKPSNILVARDGAVKLLDFGIAKLIDADGAAAEPHTLTAMRPMSLESASPEQVRGERVTTATDVWALGALLYRLLAERPPYDLSAPPHETARAICEEDPTSPSEAVGDPRLARRLAGDLDTIVAKAMHKDPARRYSTVDELAKDVARHVGGYRVLARPDSIRYRTTTFVRRHTARVAVAALVAVALVAAGVAAVWQAHVARQERARAERRFNDVRRLANSFLFEFHDAIEDLPGSTKARELVVRRATEYLDSLSREATGDASLQRELGAAYDRIGDVQGLPGFANLGNTQGALASHRRALELREALAATVPDPAVHAELAATLSHLASLMTDVNDPRAALDLLHRAQAIRERLLAGNPDGRAERRSVAIGYHNLADAQIALDDLSGALESVRKETGAFETLLARDPQDARAQRDAALADKKLGALAERSSDFPSALASYRKALALDRPRADAHPNDAQAQLDVSFSSASIGHILSLMGDTAGALDQYHDALDRRERIATADPANVTAQDAVMRAHTSLGEVLERAGRHADAEQELRRALPIASKRYAADPTNVAVAQRLAFVYGGLVRVERTIASSAKDTAASAQHWREMRVWCQKALDVWEHIRAHGGLSAAHQEERDSLVAAIAQSDAALARTAASRDPGKLR